MPPPGLGGVARDNTRPEQMEIVVLRERGEGTVVENFPTEGVLVKLLYLVLTEYNERLMKRRLRGFDSLGEGGRPSQTQLR